jgi:hypothetical protein
MVEIGVDGVPAQPRSNALYFESAYEPEYCEAE